MELRSGRRLRRWPPPQHGRMDLISDFPDEILLLILARLRCVRTAVQAGLLSRRWRGLWTGLTDLILTLHGCEPATIESVLARFAVSTPAVSTIDIHLQTRHTSDHVNSLLRAAARLSPKELVFTSSGSMEKWAKIKLPCFHCTTSIKLDSRSFHVHIELSLCGRRVCITREAVPLRQHLQPWRIAQPLHPPAHAKRHLPVQSCPLHHVATEQRVPCARECVPHGQIVGLGSLLNHCRRLRILSVTCLDSQELMLPADEFVTLEKLSLSGNIVGLGTLLSRCQRLCVLSVTFRGMALGSLEAALATLEEVTTPPGPTLSLLGIKIPWRDVNAASFASLLGTAARLSPQGLVLTDNFEGCSVGTIYHQKQINVDLPCFRRATSIEMSLQHVGFTSLPMDEFPMLKRLSLPGRCITVDVSTLVTRCPLLRVLNINIATINFMVHSPSLQKLYVYMDLSTECHDIDIVTPMLKQLHLRVRADKDTSVSISAPAVEKISWLCCYTWLSLVFGFWRLSHMSVHTIERSGEDNREHKLWLHLNARGNHLDAKLNFAQEMEKLPVTFSVLELNFESACHVYGALGLRLLRMRWIRAATKKLKVVLHCPMVTQTCQGNCTCHKPENWRNQIAFYTRLEEVEIQGFTGEDHEHDFLTMIFKCSPVLKTMTVKLAQKTGGCATKLSSIFSAHPSVNCYSYFSSGELVPRTSG